MSPHAIGLYDSYMGMRDAFGAVKTYFDAYSSNYSFPSFSPVDLINRLGLVEFHANLAISAEFSKIFRFILTGIMLFIGASMRHIVPVFNRYVGVFRGYIGVIMRYIVEIFSTVRTRSSYYDPVKDKTTTINSNSTDNYQNTSAYPNNSKQCMIASGGNDGGDGKKPGNNGPFSHIQHLTELRIELIILRYILQQILQ
jgi:hypothetical protein